MSTQPPDTGPARRPQAFGPVEGRLTHQSEDHEQGWREAPAPADSPGGQLPPLRADRVAPKESLAKRFDERVEETKRLDDERG